MRFILTIILLSLVTGVNAGEGLGKSALKKIDKFVSREFEGTEEIRRESIILNEGQRSILPEMVDDKSLFRLTIEDAVVGYLIPASSMGRNETFDYLVLYDAEFTVKSIEILSYTSNYGMEIRNRKWLKQYSGYSGGDLKYGKDIQAVSGATISAESLTRDIMLLTKSLKKANIK